MKKNQKIKAARASLIPLNASAAKICKLAALKQCSFFNAYVACGMAHHTRPKGCGL
jgi:hypothetical protein